MIESAPAITVLMPVYNAERFLRDSVESILSQSFTNFEFLIIDDGSTDKSVNIIESYTDKRIRLVKNESNAGIAASLNKGIEMARTELIARMDADDISMPDRLSLQYNHFHKEQDCVLLSANAHVISEDRVLIRIDDFPCEHYYYNLNFICWIYHSTVMYRRSAVLAAGGYSSEYAEDFDLWWKMARNGRLSHLDIHLLDYRETKESTSSVMKRDEYEHAQIKQVLRNLRYFTGDNFSISYAEIQCFRYDFQPLVSQQSVSKIIACLKKLDYINKRISALPNINCKKMQVDIAGKGKKEYIILSLTNYLHPLQAAWLSFRTRHVKRAIGNLVNWLFPK
jgi:glycosyltransferase involved in cell wall biosynthesis